MGVEGDSTLIIQHWCASRGFCGANCLAWPQNAGALSGKALCDARNLLRRRTLCRPEANKTVRPTPEGCLSTTVVLLGALPVGGMPSEFARDKVPCGMAIVPYRIAPSQSDESSRPEGARLLTFRGEYPIRGAGKTVRRTPRPQTRRRPDGELSTIGRRLAVCAIGTIALLSYPQRLDLERPKRELDAAIDERQIPQRGLHQVGLRDRRHRHPEA